MTLLELLEARLERAEHKFLLAQTELGNFYVRTSGHRWTEAEVLENETLHFAINARKWAFEELRSLHQEYCEENE